MTVLSALLAATLQVAASSDAAGQDYALTHHKKVLQRYMVTAEKAGRKAVAQVSTQALSGRETTPMRYARALRIKRAELRAMRAYARAADVFYAALSRCQRRLANEEMGRKRDPHAGIAGRTFLPAALFEQVDAEWTVKPTSDEVAHFYPTRADELGAGGRVRVNCTVALDGFAKDCEVTSEQPTGLGFGNAALQLTALTRFKPTIKDGSPVEGHVTIPMVFGPPRPPPPMAVLPPPRSAH